MPASHRTLWCIGFAFALALPTLITSRGFSSDLLPPPEWDTWIETTDWLAVSVRAQDATVPGAVQPARGERSQDVAEFLELVDFGAASPATPPTGGEKPGDGPGQNTVPPNFKLTQAPEISQVIQQSKRVQTTEFQKRSQLSLEPNIRGYQGPDVYMLSDGLYWEPIRPDLDSMLNRLDPSMYEDLSVLAGPYGLRYGPAFAFMRILNQDTPRNPNGYESHFRTGISTRTNGGQVYGRETVYGGGSDWGYIINYGNRVGGDYDPGGNSTQPAVPGSYKSQSLLGQVGFDLSPESNLEFRFRRLDDTDTEYPLQFFDVDYMGVDAYSLHYDSEDPCGCGTFSMMGWYSRSRFHGDTFPAQFGSPYYSIDRVNASLEQRFPNTDVNLAGWTGGHVMITGARVNKTYGDPDATLLSLGADVRYMTRRINERFIDLNGGSLPPINTNLPNSSLVDPGIYSELTLGWLPYVTTTVGARLDWVHTTADAAEIRPNYNLYDYRFQLDQNDVLHSYYLSNEMELNSHWTVRLAGGYSQRPPTTLERYADGVFVSTSQNGLTRVLGTPTLEPEKVWQIDATLQGQWDRWGGRLTGFYSWVDDPITYLGAPVIDPTGAYLVRYINGNLFIRNGFEAVGEWKLSDMLTAFATGRYVWGEDSNILVDGVGYRDLPLMGIFPISSDVGIRIHDADSGRRWGLEFAARMVASQNRTASLRLGITDVDGLDPNWESRTGGFTVFRLGGYYNVTENMNVVGGVDNLFDRSYLEHLNQRLPYDNIGGERFQEVAVLSPGITPYFGLEWTY